MLVSEGAVPTVRHGADVITCRALDCVGPFVSLVSALYGDGGSGLWFVELWGIYLSGFLMCDLINMLSSLVENFLPRAARATPYNASPLGYPPASRIGRVRGGAKLPLFPPLRSTCAFTCDDTKKKKK